MTEMGARMPRPRPRKRARSVSNCALPTSPSTTARWAAHAGDSFGRAAPARGQTAPDDGDGTPSPRRDWKRPGVPYRPLSVARRPRHTKSLRSHEPSSNVWRFVTRRCLRIVLGETVTSSRVVIVPSLLTISTPILEERRLVTIGFDSTGLVPRRPHGPAVDIAQEDVCAPAIARRVHRRQRVTARSPQRLYPDPPPSSSRRSGRWKAAASGRFGW